MTIQELGRANIKMAENIDELTNNNGFIVQLFYGTEFNGRETDDVYLMRCLPITEDDPSKLRLDQIEQETETGMILFEAIPCAQARIFISPARRNERHSGVVQFKPAELNFGLDLIQQAFRKKGYTFS